MKFLISPLLATLLGFLTASAAPVVTTITPKGFGTTVSDANGTFNIKGGTTLGTTRLLQGFSTFNLGTGNTADFNVASSITSIFARVTGGPSAIDGTFTATVPSGGLSGATLYFLNPAGVLFTANAQVVTATGDVNVTSGRKSAPTPTTTAHPRRSDAGPCRLSR